jgi:hypothetical protein
LKAFNMLLKSLCFSTFPSPRWIWESGSSISAHRTQGTLVVKDDGCVQAS